MAKIEVRSSSFEITKKGDEIRLDNENLDYDLIKLPNGQYHLIVDNKSFTIEVLSKDTNNGKLKLKVNGETVNTVLNNKLAELLKTLGMESGKKKLKDLKAPMPGLVLELKVAEGEQVSEGQDLLVLEAMKMENAIKSPQDGVIDKIVVQQQEKVDKNQVLVSFQ